MKGELGFDPECCDYGTATQVVRSILREWSSIDWLEPSAVTDDDAISTFRAHQRLAHAVAPELFPLDVDVRCVTGDRDAFASWCVRVRANTAWDWRFSVLKMLSRTYAQLHDWDAQRDPRAVRPTGPLGPCAGSLFLVIGEPGKEQVFWNSILPAITGAVDLPREHAEALAFYTSYAHADALDCIKWQLADEASPLAANPFLPLLRCYQSGAYPFSLDARTVVLFRAGR